MQREILTVEQGTPEWFEARIGSIGGSSISSVCAKGTGKMRSNLLYRLAGEILSGEKYIGYKNDYMDYGTEMEPEARFCYGVKNNVDVFEIGLVRLDQYKHFSPDGLVGDDGIIEIKCVIPSVHVATICSDKIPSEYRKQVQWGLFITDRKWVDFISYCPKIVDMPLFIKRTGRDEKLIKEMNIEADKFICDLQEIVAKISSVPF